MKKYFILGICLLLGISNARAQVTMGSHEAPVKGALLDLKDGTATGNATATKGLLLPRVKLSDKKNLFPMFEADGANYKIGTTTYTKADEDAKHLGLIVYHIDKCALEGTGLYVWNPDGWKKINKGGEAGGVSFNNDYFDLPSGHDARPLTAQNLTIGWTMPGNLTYTKKNIFGGGVPFAGANALPGSPLTVNPTSIDLLPKELTISNPEQPWQSREAQLSFTDTECGNMKRTVTLNQTHYALKVNNALTSSRIFFTTTKTGTFDVIGNVSYKISISDKHNILKTLTPSVEGVHGSTIKNYPYKSSNLNRQTFQFQTNSANDHQICSIIFADNMIPKRFDDITLSILKCNPSGHDGSLEDWVKLAGFTDADIAATPTGGTLMDGTKPKTRPNGIQLHRDQDGNLFLSGNFGYEDLGKTKERRWMLNNLSAKTYAKPHRLNLTPKHAYGGGSVPRYIYPEKEKATSSNSAGFYNANKRYGLQYNFDCASGGKELGVDDHEHSATPQTDIVQGICPNGWHLPSDAEWSQLEKEMDDNINTYSSLTTGGQFDGYVNEHPNERMINYNLRYVTAMVEACPTKHGPSWLDEVGGGSNWIEDNEKKPGLNIIMISSAAYNELIDDFWYGSLAVLHSSSTSTPTSNVEGIMRYIVTPHYSYAKDYGIEKSKSTLSVSASVYTAPVRCKKTN